MSDFDRLGDVGVANKYVPCIWPGYLLHGYCPNAIFFYANRHSVYDVTRDQPRETPVEESEQEGFPNICSRCFRNVFPSHATVPGGSALSNDVSQDVGCLKVETPSDGQWFDGLAALNVLYRRARSRLR